MSSRSGGRKRDGGGDRPRVGFTLVEMIVTLAVACILLVSVVAFLVNGVVSSTKTTAINDATMKGRHVFEHMTREMAMAADLSQTNFSTPNPNPTPLPSGSYPSYAQFNYRVAVGAEGTTQDTPLTSSQITVNLAAAATAADYPAAGDYLLLSYPSLGTTGTVITAVSPSVNPQAAGQVTLTLSASLATLSGSSSTDSDVQAYQIATIQRQRTYTMANDPTTGDLQLWWYDGLNPAPYVVAKNLPAIGPASLYPAGQYPFVAEPKDSTSSSTAYFVGLNLNLQVPQSEGVQVLAGQSQFYTNNTVRAVFSNKSQQSFSLVYLPTPTPTPSPTPVPTPTPSPTPIPTPTPSPVPTPIPTPTHVPTPTSAPTPRSDEPSRGDTDPHTDTDADRDPHAGSDAHTDADADPHSHADSDSDFPADCDPDAHPHSDLTADPHSHAHADTDRAAHRHSHAHADHPTHGHAHADHAAHRNTDSDHAAHRHAHPDSDHTTHGHADSDHAAHRHSDPDSDHAAHRHSDPDSDSHPDADPHYPAHGHAHAHPDADHAADAHAFADTYTLADAHSDSDAHPVTKANAHTVADPDAFTDPDAFAGADSVAHSDAGADLSAADADAQAEPERASDPPPDN